jgi:pantothenate kinase
VLDPAGLLAAVRVLAADRPRTVVGLAGPPGAGKTTLARWLAAALPGALAGAYLPMDGFHLANAVLTDLGRADRKGAPDTFDAHGYVALLRRVAAADHTVYAPRFHREIEESYAAEIAIGPEVRVVVTEGNYLLLADPPWSAVRGCLDAVWYVAVPDAERVDRLIRRRVGLGQQVDVARAWATGSDQRNADLVAATRPRADGEVSGSSPLPGAGGP